MKTLLFLGLDSMYVLIYVRMYVYMYLYMYVCMLGSGWTVAELKAALAENLTTLSNSLSRFPFVIHTYIHT